MNATLPNATAPAHGPGVSRRREDDWLFFSAILAERPLSAHDFPELLAWNAFLPGAAKFVLTPELRVELRAEIPFDESRDVALSKLAIATSQGFETAFVFWADPVAVATFASTEVAPKMPPSLIDACNACGWAVLQRDEQFLRLDLAVADARWSAHVHMLNNGATRISIELATISVHEATCRAAVAQMLLVAGGALRWARPFAHERDDSIAAGLEIVFPATPDTAEISDALSTLSIGCRLSGEEAAMLLRPEVAREFLEATAPLPSQPATINHKKQESPWSSSPH